MALSRREQAVALISNGIAAYSIYRETGSLPPNVTLFDFVLKAVPDGVRPEITAELIDEIFEYVSSAHNS